MRECSATRVATPSVGHRFLHWVDRHPRRFTSILALGVLGTVAALVFACIRVVALLR